MAVPRAIAGAIYYLSGVLVKAETKDVAKRLIAKGFRAATEGMKNSKLPIKSVTENNIVTFLTRALAKAIKEAKDLRAPPKLDKFGRPIARGQGNNKLGSSGQSATGRKLGSRRMANFGKVRGGKGRAESMAKAKPTTTGGSKPLTTSKPDPVLKPAPVKANPKPGLSAGSTSRTVVRIRPKPASSSGSKIVSAGPTIAGLIAAGAIGKVAYEAYIKENDPTASQIKAADKKIETIAQDDVYAQRLLEKTKQIDETVLRAKKKTKADALKEKIRARVKAKVAEAKAAEAKAAEAKVAEAKEVKLGVNINKPSRIRPKLRPRVVEAEPMSLGSYLNAEIKSRKSTRTKEIAKAKKGNYKSIAEAKKAKSLYYIKDGKPMAAVYKQDLKGL